jgi:cell division protein YceG involved in septum cleavage
LSRRDRSQQARERSAEERERARLEREQRRSSRRGEAQVQHEAGHDGGDSVAAQPSGGAPLPTEPSLSVGVPPAPTAEHLVVEAPSFAESPALESPSSAEPPDVQPPSVAGLPPVESPRFAPGSVESPALEPLPAPGPVEPTSAALARARRRSRRARLGAVLALAVVIAAVVLLLRPLLSSSHPKPPPPRPVVKVLIPEGKTRAQIAQIAAAAGLTGDYRSASRRSPLLNPTRYGAAAGTSSLEGFLFPATYDLFRGAPASHLVEEQLLAFRERFGVEDIERARALHLTPYQLLIVASMVEREAQVSADRPKIAAVIYNRLRQGMPLGIDATIYYAIEQRTGIATYTRELSEAQLHIDSPYNTRTHVGLPPTPISNPGMASIEAAAHPAHVPYLYYVLAPNGCGEHVFSTTLAQFEVDAAAYHAALSRNGGHLPACKAK